MSSEGQEAVEYRDELCREIGVVVLRFVPMLERLGWQKAVSARTYLHPTSPATGVVVDFIDVACGFAGAPAARARLLEVAHAWDLDRSEISV